MLKRPALLAREHEARPGARCRRRAQCAGLPQSLVNGAEPRDSVIGASERAHARAATGTWRGAGRHRVGSGRVSRRFAGLGSLCQVQQRLAPPWTPL